MKKISAYPYEKSYLIYDKLMEHVDYIDWAEYIDEIFEHHNEDGTTILDVACGTGTFLPLFSKMGYNCTGAELSAPMLEIAKEKVSPFDVELYCQDMLDLEIDAKFDLIVCLFDSVNYLKHASQLTTLFNKVEKHLEENGVFVFDVATQTSCKEHFMNFTESGSHNVIDYERHSTFDVETSVQITDIDVVIDGKEYSEHHEQLIYSVSDIEKAIRASNLRLLGTHGDFDLEPIDKSTERAHFVLGR